MQFGYTPEFLTREGEPWFPVMGEIHYSRLPAAEWEDSLYQMKTGGVTVASCYAIWIHHEEVKGEWDFDGSKDLRRFVETCKACGLKLFLRIGPWCHGEVRNGGFPDWLLQEDFLPRTNDEGYLAQVARYYGKLFEQVAGLLEKDGGPIIGVQIENEYGHVGGLTGEAGEEHMRTLTGLAKASGFDVPLYTATGWGGAVTGGLLPVMGGYCEAPWDQRLTDIEPSGNYVFTPERNDHNIGSDHGMFEGITFDPAQFPYLTAELGGGLQATHHRRPVATGKDTAAMSVTKLGSGVNLLGYYMYHGGVNPKGTMSTLQESRETGYPNDLPVWSYDFRAPLGAYGQYHDAYHELRMLALFAADFGGQLCRMPPLFPSDNPIDPKDDTRLRYSFRMDESGAGYLFFTNYVRRMQRPDFHGLRLTVPGTGRTLPALDIPADAFGFYPFDMPVEGGVIHFAQATPLCRVGRTTVLYGESVDATQGADVLLLSREEARQAYKIILGQEHLLLSENPVLEGPHGYRLLASTQKVSFKAYPPLAKTPDLFIDHGMEGAFACYGRALPQGTATCTVQQAEGNRYRLLIHYEREDYDYHLHIHYRADRATVYVGGEPVMDDFWADGRFCVGLKRHGFPSVLEIELEPLHRDSPVYLERWPEMKGDCVCALDRVEVERILEVTL